MCEQPIFCIIGIKRVYLAALINLSIFIEIDLLMWKLEFITRFDVFSFFLLIYDNEIYINQYLLIALGLNAI